jgi:hypothetical protein
MEATTFTCSICGEGSRDICIACTKDTCVNHLCERCKRCSDCCVCEVRLIDHHEHNGKVILTLPLEELEIAAGLPPEEPPPEEPGQF